MNRAYSILDIKSVDDEARVIEGIASTPSPDRMGDIVEPLGAKFALPMPLLWQHNHDEPIGQVEFAKPTAKGIPFKARLAQTAEPGTLKDRLDEAWQSIKLGLVRAVSIGFRSIEHSFMESGGVRFHSWEWLELSAVTVPANAEATITSIKSIDEELRARIGTSRPELEGSAERPQSPAAVGTSVKTPTPKGRTMNKQMTVGEQIAAFKSLYDAKQARMDEIQDTVASESRTKTAEEREEYDTLRDEVKGISQEIADLQEREESLKRRAAPVEKADTPERGAALRAAFGSVAIRKQLEPGVLYTRFIGAQLMARQLMMPAWEIAARKWRDTPELESMLKAAVVPGSTYDTTFAEPLVQLQNAQGEFIELLVSKQIIGRIPGLDQVDFNIQVPRGTSDPTGYWVGEGDNTPLSRSAFDSVSLTFAKVAAIVPMTKDLLKFSTPKAEIKVRDGLIRALAYRADRDFLDPTKAVTTGISPASLTNGVTAVDATGTSADAFRDDFGSMLENMLEANEDPAGIVIVMTPQQALRLGLMRNSLGGREFPDISQAGGFIEGFPVITSTNIVSTGSSPVDGYPIVALNAPNVMIAQGGVQVDMSDQASLQMSDSPDSPETASTVAVSLFQRDMVALKAVQHLTWEKAHTSSVQYIAYAKYQ